MSNRWMDSPEKIAERLKLEHTYHYLENMSYYLEMCCVFRDNLLDRFAVISLDGGIVYEAVKIIDIQIEKTHDGIHLLVCVGEIMTGKFKGMRFTNKSRVEDGFDMDIKAVYDDLSIAAVRI